ncbi:YcjF family protein [Sulfurospirillum barnesii]|uniref:Uncharacterized protein associated with GTPases n=1 Tax=Sulfurospirillum barnesii (strain ATCC 700032 / DSM 10660 / SES-3) TaxID=760154 RepID=I3XVT1_SULBS|nr:DUF697 domain-containing protein [Sulfurospirillum barnesii]AFL68055.1 uncharacterized protein associated with GTPases [Sulfurospirillum barnesii SES-3]
MATEVKEEKVVEGSVFETVSFDERKQKTDEIVKRHVYGAMGVGLVPIPLIDFIGVTSVQVDMLSTLAQYYGVTFKKEMAKNLIGSLVGGAVPAGLGMPIASILKGIPLVGQTVGALGMSMVAGASTYAVGRVFVQHFESGGTFLSFDPGAVREYFKEEFNIGKTVAKEASAKK